MYILSFFLLIVIPLFAQVDIEWGAYACFDASNGAIWYSDINETIYGLIFISNHTARFDPSGTGGTDESNSGYWGDTKSGSGASNVHVLMSETFDGESPTEIYPANANNLVESYGDYYQTNRRSYEDTLDFYEISGRRVYPGSRFEVYPYGSSSGVGSTCFDVYYVLNLGYLAGENICVNGDDSEGTDWENSYDGRVYGMRILRKSGYVQENEENGKSFWGNQFRGRSMNFVVEDEQGNVAFGDDAGPGFNIENDYGDWYDIFGQLSTASPLDFFVKRDITTEDVFTFRFRYNNAAGEICFNVYYLTDEDDVAEILGEELTWAPTSSPITSEPTLSPITGEPTLSPITSDPTSSPITSDPTSSPTTSDPTSSPVTSSPTKNPTTPDTDTNPPSQSPVTTPRPTLSEVEYSLDVVVALEFTGGEDPCETYDFDTIASNVFGDGDDYEFEIESCESTEVSNQKTVRKLQQDTIWDVALDFVLYVASTSVQNRLSEASTADNWETQWMQYAEDNNIEDVSVAAEEPVVTCIPGDNDCPNPNSAFQFSVMLVSFSTLIFLFYV